MGASVFVRFAPSPTGLLHLGNLRICLFNWFFARAQGGTFLLRLDDTDQSRSTTEFVDAIQRDLKWIGIDWDVCFAQSTRLDFYMPYIERLKASGRIYPCYETQEELEQRRVILRANHKAPVFDRDHRIIDTSRPPHWRFALYRNIETWDDLMQGECRYDLSHVSDPIVIREDGSLSYLLTSVLDDQDPERPMTHIVRGLDHYVNTAIHRQMFVALDRPCPLFAHLPLIQHITGQKFSKRVGGHAIEDWRKEGVLPISVAQVLFNLSRAQPVFEKSLTALSAAFDWNLYSKASEVRLDPDSIRKTCSKQLAMMSLSEVQACLPDIHHIDAHRWACISKNVHTLVEIETWDKVFDSEWKLSHLDTSLKLLRDTSFLSACLNQWKKAIAESLEKEWSELWKVWTGHLALEFNVKLPEVYRSLRWILTGHIQGAPMAEVLSVLPVEVIECRLQEAAEICPSG